MRFILLILAANVLLLANGTNSDNISPFKDFTPPKLYSPNVAWSVFIKHQLDRTDKNEYFFVTDLLDNLADLFHISGGFYANFSKGNRYKDSRNNGYNMQEQSVVLGFVSNEISKIKFAFLRDNISDDKQPNHSIKTQLHVAKFNARVGDKKPNNTLNLKLSLKDTTRQVDNFKLRRSAQNVKIGLNGLNLDAKLGYDAKFSSFHNFFGKASDSGWINNLPNKQRHSRLNLDFEYKSEFYKDYLSSKMHQNGFILATATNLIIHNRRHLNAILPINKNAVISKNAVVLIDSLNLRANFNFAKNFGVKTSLFYSYGKNKTGNTLYQIHPFQANFAISYSDYLGFNLAVAV